MKNALPLVILGLFIFIMGYVLVSMLFPDKLPLQQRVSSPFLCTDGDTKPCASGECSGVSKCIKGVWGGCKWEQLCTPDTRVPCVKQGCAYALKECNPCGTGWGECLAITE